MAISLSKKMAQKIVETVKDVCGHDINFINTEGIIFASTDESRIGEFHEIGKKIIESKEIIEVDTDNSFLGTHKGVNIPFVYNKEIIAAIGISGEPEKVRKYGLLAQKITSLLLKEQELDVYNYGKKGQIHYVLDALLGNKSIAREYLEEFFTKRGLSLKSDYRTVIVKMNARYHLSNLTMMENEVYQMFDRLPFAIYTFNYPNEYWLLLTEENYKKWNYILYKFAKKYREILQVGIGARDSLKRQYHSYESAQIALKSLNVQENIACYDDLSLDILLGSIPTGIVDKFLDKILKNLSKEEILFLENYYACDMSLKETANRMFLHKNTVQYKLDRIEKKTGYCPRKFQDAVVFYMAIRMK